MTTDLDTGTQLAGWIAQQIPDATDVRLKGAGQIELGYSADMLLLTVFWTAAGVENQRDVVLRARPQPPGLLEPYDMKRQFDVLRALESTPVRSPKVLWIDEAGTVLGRPFYVMERLPGEVYEKEMPEGFDASPDRIRRMADHVIEEVAAIHRVNLQQTGLDTLSVGHDYLDRDLGHWTSELRRVQRGPLPALERVAAELQARRPEPTPQVTLVHGDAKCGNFAFVGEDVTGVFDWEMTSVGDPMADIGWVEVTWRLTKPFSVLQDSDFEAMVAKYELLTGVVVHDRSWYRAYQTFKMAVILLVGAMLFDAGHSQDRRFAEMSLGIPFFTQLALTELGVDEQLEAGPVGPRAERLSSIGSQA